MKRLKWRNIFFLLVCIIFLIIGWKSLLSEKKQEKTPPEEEQKEVIQYDKNYSDIEINSDSKDKKHGGYWISYPTIPDKQIADSIKQYITEKIDGYNHRILDEEIPKTQETELNISYSITHYSKQTISILFDSYEYLSGAHGISSIDSKTFDLETHKQLTLKDLFKEDSDYLSLLSKISYNELKKNKEIAINKELLQEGTAPIETNFQHFALLNDSILFYFPPYQVAAGALGVQELAIKKELLEDMLLTTYKQEENNQNRLEEAPPKNIVTELPDIAKIDPTKKVIALTFDDGPSNKPTSKILDALKKYKGHATFFVLGQRVQYYPEIVHRAIKEGHEIGNHTWDHPLLTKATKEKAKKEIEDTDQLIKELTGYDTSLIRPPYGAISEELKKEQEKEIVLWTIDPQDWKYHNKNKIVKKVMTEAKDESIILMHDIYDISADAAVEIIKQLTEDNYQLVTVSQLLDVKRERERS